MKGREAPEHRDRVDQSLEKTPRGALWTSATFLRFGGTSARLAQHGGLHMGLCRGRVSLPRALSMFHNKSARPCSHHKHLLATFTVPTCRPHYSGSATPSQCHGALRFLAVSSLACKFGLPDSVLRNARRLLARSPLLFRGRTCKTKARSHCVLVCPCVCVCVCICVCVCVYMCA